MRLGRFICRQCELRWLFSLHKKTTENEKKNRRENNFDLNLICYRSVVEIGRRTWTWLYTSILLLKFFSIPLIKDTGFFE